MSVYIPGMEMPTNCSECAFCGYYGNGEHMCDIIQKAVEYESAKMSRLDDCPLIPVPEHGRLIDADALAHDLDFDVENDQRALDEMNLVGKEREHLQFDKDCKQNCMWYLSESPTIIPADKEEE